MIRFSHQCSEVFISRLIAGFFYQVGRLAGRLEGWFKMSYRWETGAGRSVIGIRDNRLFGIGKVGR